MNDIEDRIRRARPTGAHRDMELTNRAEAELSALLKEPEHTDSAGASALDSDTEETPSRQRPSRSALWVLAACGAVVAGVAGYQVLADDDPSPVAEEESPETGEDGLDSTDSDGTDSGTDDEGAPMADYPRYETLEQALEQSAAVVVGEPLDWEAEEVQGLHYTLATFDVHEVLYGDLSDGDAIEIRQSSSPQDPGSSISGYYVHLEDVDSEAILLFLTEKIEGAYNPINPMEGIHAVDNGTISPVQETVIDLPDTLDELRDQIDG